MSDSESNKVTNPDGTTTVTYEDGSTKTFDQEDNEIHSTPATSQQQEADSSAQSEPGKDDEGKIVDEEAAANKADDNVVVDNTTYTTQALAGAPAVAGTPYSAQDPGQVAVESVPVAPRGLPKPVPPKTSTPAMVGAAAVPVASIKQSVPISQPKAALAAVPTATVNPAPPATGLAPVVGGMPAGTGANTTFQTTSLH
jgi:hypothetical protein